MIEDAAQGVRLNGWPSFEDFSQEVFHASSSDMFDSILRAPFSKKSLLSSLHDSFLINTQEIARNYIFPSRDKVISFRLRHFQTCIFWFINTTSLHASLINTDNSPLINEPPTPYSCSQGREGRVLSAVEKPLSRRA